MNQKLFKKIPGLFIVATPIGNFDDITFRAVEVLKNADIIACEDTRVTDKILRHFNIKASMKCYNDFSSDSDREYLIKQIEEGKMVALVSDAGTPLISDPGYKLVEQLHEQDLPIFTIPGPSSVIAALTVAAQPTNRFLFEGFLPAKTVARKKALEELKPINATLVFFESARRLVETIEDMHIVYDDTRNVTVIRELTKTYEEVKKDSFENVIAYYKENEPRGEIIIVISPPIKDDFTEDDLDNHLKILLEQMSLKDAVSLAAQNLKLPKKVIYERALFLSGKKG
jgi:16S rRNA (cytidine1402-2'-O)-methyltransferase